MYDTKRELTYNDSVIQVFGLALVTSASIFMRSVLANNLVITAFFVICLILYVLKVLMVMRLDKNNFFKMTLWLFIYLGAFALNYRFFPDMRSYYTEYLSKIIINIVLCIPVAVLLSGVDDFDKAIRILRPYAYIGITMMVLVSSLIMVDEQYQSYGIHLMTFWILIVLNWKDNRKRIDLYCAIVTSVFFLFGGRQTLVTFCLIIIWTILRNKTMDKRSRHLRSSMLILATLLFMTQWQYIVDIFKSIMQVLNINSRNVDAILNGEVFDASNRSSIYTYCLEIIKDKGMGVSGFFADRYYLRQYRYNIGYAHNFIYEILIDFGMLLGSVFIVGLFYLLVRGIMQGSRSKRNLVIAMCIITMVRLIVSSSILIDKNFIFLLGFLFNYSTNKNTQNVIQIY